MCVTRRFPSFTEFHIKLEGFGLGFFFVSLNFPGFCLVLLGFTGFYLVLLGFTGFYWVLPGFN